MRGTRRRSTEGTRLRAGWRRWAVLGSLALLLAACGGETSTAGSAMGNATSTAPASGAPGGAGPTTTAGRGPASPAPNAAALGERSERGGLALTVLKASGVKNINPAIAAQGDGYYLVLEVVIENTSLQQARYQRYNFGLNDAIGRGYQPSIFAPEPGLPTGGDLGRGQKVQGNLAFEVPPSATGLFVAYNPEQATGIRDPFQVKVGDAVTYAPAPGLPASATPAAGSAAPAAGTPRTPTVAPARTPTTPGGRAPTAPPAVGGQLYRDPQGRFSFTPPDGWTQNTATGTDIRFDAPNNAATMNLNLEDVSGVPGLTLEQYDAAIERQLSRQFPGYATVSKDRVTVAGQPAYRRTITATVSGTPLRIIAVYLLKSETAHVLIMAAPQDRFDSVAPAFEGIIQSYRVD